MLTNRKKQTRSSQNISKLQLETLENRVLLSNAIIDDFGSTYRTAGVAVLDDAGDYSVDSDLYSFRDRDVLTFTAVGSGQMNLTLDTSESDLHPIVVVYNERHRLATFSNYRLHDGDTELAFLVEEGKDYSIKVQSVRRTSGEYSLTLDGPEIGQLWEDDYGSKYRVANEVIEAGVNSGQILNARANDIDIIQFTAVKSGTVTATMTPQDEALNAVLWARKSNGRWIGRSNSSLNGGSETLTFDVVEGKTYYLLADGYRRSQGQYTLEISGDVLTEPVDSEPQESEPATSQYSNTYALLIGATEYSLLNDLDETAVDVDLMTDTLINTFDIVPDNIKTIVGGSEDVNYSSVYSGIKWLDSVTGENDLAIIFYSGHGGYGKSVLKNDNETLILPDNTQLSEYELTKFLAGFEKEADKLLILDSCYSGGFANIANTVDNTAVIASSAYDQVSWGNTPSYKSSGSSDSSLFTGWFTTALNENRVQGSILDNNSDGKVSFGEAFNWTDSMVNDITGYNWNNQDPLMNILLGDIIL